jgi:hypothetical protein
LTIKEADKQDVTRSRLAFREIWRQRGERFSVVAKETSFQKVTTSGWLTGRFGGKEMRGSVWMIQRR